ncbi:MAG: LysM domain-containing protein [Chloroflexota bacterium]
MKKFIKLLFVAIALQLLVVSVSYAAPRSGGYDGGGGTDGAGVYHTVQYGETLFSIGRLYGVNHTWRRTKCMNSSAGHWV